jgi:hypothetical protein
MLRALSSLEALPAAVDEFTKAAAEPGDRDLALRHEGREQLRPLALIAIESPGLDQFGAGIFVVRIHGPCPVSFAPSGAWHFKMAQQRAAIGL